MKYTKQQLRELSQAIQANMFNNPITLLSANRNATCSNCGGVLVVSNFVGYCNNRCKSNN